MAWPFPHRGTSKARLARLGSEMIGIGARQRLPPQETCGGFRSRANSFSTIDTSSRPSSASSSKLSASFMSDSSVNGDSLQMLLTSVDSESQVLPPYTACHQTPHGHIGNVGPRPMSRMQRCRSEVCRSAKNPRFGEFRTIEEIDNKHGNEDLAFIMRRSRHKSEHCASRL